MNRVRHRLSDDACISPVYSMSPLQPKILVQLYIDSIRLDALIPADVTTPISDGGVAL